MVQLRRQKYVSGKMRLKSIFQKKWDETKISKIIHFKIFSLISWLFMRKTKNSLQKAYKNRYFPSYAHSHKKSRKRSSHKENNFMWNHTRRIFTRKMFNVLSTEPTGRHYERLNMISYIKLSFQAPSYDHNLLTRAYTLKTVHDPVSLNSSSKTKITHNGQH